MMPLLTALFQAASDALKAYCKHTEWKMKTHKETTINALEDEKLTLADSGTASDKLRLETICARLKRAKDQ
jgi:hypothetical protein